MGLGHGNTPTWLNQTDSGRTWTSANRVVQSGLVLNLDAGASTSYPGSGTTWTDLSGTGSVSSATGALPIYNTTDTIGAVKGSGTRTDAFASSLVLAVPMDGANNGTTFTDESPTIRGSGTAKTITRFADAKTLTAVSKFYGSSGFFDGTGDYLTAASSNDFAFGTGDFTIEGWINPTAYTYAYNAIASTRGVSGTNNGFNIGVSNTGSLFLYTNLFILTATSSVSLNTWSHFAFVRASASLKVYSNGILVGTAALPNDFTLQTFWVASVNNTENWTGYLQDFRVYKGVAKYTANFTPPVPKNGTLTNGPTYNSANGGSIVFDGSNDYVDTFSGSGLSTFTVAIWVKTSTTASNATFFQRPSFFGKSSSGTASGDFGITISNGFVGYWSGLTTGDASYLSSILINDGIWKYIVVTNTGSVASMYLNGSQLSDSSLTINGVSLNSENFWIGAKGGSETPGSYCNCEISNVKVYNRALTAAEVSQNYNALVGRYGLTLIGVSGITATGGTIVNYSSGGVSYRAHIFTSSGTFQVTFGTGTVEYLIVAGGGSGSHGTSGFTYGGAGGGGQVLTGSTGVVSQAYSITVGSGGAGVNGNGNDGIDGSDSVFSTFTAGGGKKGLANGNGGNSGNNLFSGASRSGITGGGGGGAGGNASSTTTGGVGVSTSIVGSLVTYGGGGGGSNDSVNGLGSDGGGDGGALNNPVGSGTTNRGGGGGSTRAENPNNSGSGGSGIVIIRYSI